MKKKILLCWNYGRKSWISQFEEIFDEGQYVFINFFSKGLEKENNTKESVLYWNDFNSIDHLVDKVDPGKVVFMGLESPYVLLLNKACRERGIKTYFLQHGIFHSYRAYLYEERSMRKILAAQKKGESPVQLAESGLPQRNNRFFTASFRPGRIIVYLKIIQYLLVKKLTHSMQRALKSSAGKQLQPDYYIVYTKYLSRVFTERDHVAGEKMIEIGNMEANQLIMSVQGAPGYSYTAGDYFLFIDEAFTGSPEYLLPPIVTVEKYNGFLSILSQFAASKGKKLVVKLHPFSYNIGHFIVDANIEYVKQAGFTELVLNACGIFGFSSTLLIPAMFVKSACIFKLNDFSDIHRALLEMDYCKVLDFYDFKLQDIAFNAAATVAQREQFIKYFLYKIDDACNERLKHILNN